MNRWENFSVIEVDRLRGLIRCGIDEGIASVDAYVLFIEVSEHLVGLGVLREDDGDLRYARRIVAKHSLPT